jgi:hypothetical protein
MSWMIKISFLGSVLFVLFYSQVATAQNNKFPLEKRTWMMKEAQDLFGRYREGLRTRWGNKEEEDKFRSVFADDAQIYDDELPDTAAYNPFTRTFQFNEAVLNGLPVRSVDSLFKMRRMLFSIDSGLGNYSSSEIKNAKFNMSSIAAGSRDMQVLFVKEYTGAVFNGKQRLGNLDTLLMTIRYDADFHNPKISRIERGGSNLMKYVFAKNMVPKTNYIECDSDLDCDGLPDGLDRCPAVFGMDPYGCPTKDYTFGFTVHGGLMNSSYNATVPLDKLGTSQDNNAFSYRAVNVNSNFLTTVKVGVELDILFGRYKNYGIGGGLFYTLGVGDIIAQDSNNIAFSNTNSDSKSFLQVIKVNPEATERLFISNVAIPVYLKYSGAKRSVKSWNYFIHAGVFFPIWLGGSSNGKAKADYEAYYGATGASGKDLNYSTDAYTSPTAWHINYTNVSQNAPLSQDNSPDKAEIDRYYRRKREAGFNVGHQVTQENKNNFNRFTGFGFIMRLGLSKRLTYKSNLLFGAELIFGNNGIGPNNQYVMTQSASTQDYSSFVGAASGMSQFSIGASAAYQFRANLKKRKKKDE